MKSWDAGSTSRAWTVGVLLVVALVGCSGGSGSSSSTAQKSVELRSIPNPDAEIFMKLAATPRQTQTVRRLLQRSHLVRKYAFLTRAEALREFRKLFAADPEVLTSTTADQLPTSFRVSLADGVQPAALDRAFRDADGVDEVKSSSLTTKSDREALADLKRACIWRDRNPAASDLEIFVRLDATPTQIDAVRAAIAGSELVRSFAFVSHTEALQVFRQMFADHPKLAHSTMAADLPESFRIGLKDVQTRQLLGRELEQLPGVDVIDAQTGERATAASCRALALMST